MRWIWVGALVLAAATAAAVVLLARGSGSGTTAQGAALTVRASLDRTTVEFADSVTATVTVFLDRASLGSSDVHLREDLAPLAQLGPTRVTHATLGRLNVVTYTARASCLDDRCISTHGPKRIELRPVAVDVAQHATTTATWPLLEIRSRVSNADTAQPHPPMRSDTSPPPVSYRVAPGPLARALEVAAVMLAAAGVLLVAWAASSLLRTRRRRHAQLTGLERALALAHEAERRPEPDRRRALGLLARLLSRRDARLAGAADKLAWSAPPPTGDALAELVSQVEGEVNGA